MVYFQTKKSNLGKFCRALELKRLVCIFYGHLEYLTAIGYMLRPFGNFLDIWYIFPRFGILCQEKSGNPGRWCSVYVLLAIKFSGQTWPENWLKRRWKFRVKNVGELIFCAEEGMAHMYVGKMIKSIKNWKNRHSSFGPGKWFFSEIMQLPETSF
jgi:hypothetical protein